jgi:HAD superfamily hydrolase (TIGR01509 family)
MVAGPRAVPSALLWDVDGTLAETEEHGHRPAFNRAFAEAGLPWRWDLPTYRRLLAVSGGRERIAAYLTEVEGKPPDPELLETLMARKQLHYGQIVRSGCLPLRPGVARLIGEAAAAGVAQAIVTTSSVAAVQALAEGALREWRWAFGFWICGEDVHVKKPHPEAYTLALERLARPPLVCDPRRVVALEDSANGLAAALSAGLACLVTLSSASAQESPAGFVGARAVLDGLGDGVTPVRPRQGPPCPDGRVTLPYLACLLDPP